MSKRISRIDPNGTKGFAGHQINRNRPISFTLNGLIVEGFEGDTILSALLASGFVSAGTRNNFELALDESLQLEVYLAGEHSSPTAALPIERTKAINGAAFHTLCPSRTRGISGWIERLSRYSRHTLNLNLDLFPHPSTPWAQMPVSRQLEADLLIIGGGIAGLAAAAHAAKDGVAVILVERRPYCGGDAILFGHASKEERPEKAIPALVHQVEAAGNISVLTCSEAVAISAQGAKIHQVLNANDGPTTRIVEINCDRTIIATGTADRLPFFPGNRLPGAVGLGTAFHLGMGYGLCPGGEIAITTNNNAAYRFALMADDSGITVSKLMDSRLSPQSRFAEFAKAYGIRSEPGTKPLDLRTDTTSQRLNLKTGLSWQGAVGEAQTMSVDGAIISGGWLPRLSLWLGAGGHIATSNENGAPSAIGSLANITLAGSCAGLLSGDAVTQSGIAAVETLFGRVSVKISDRKIDEKFETPDGELPISIAATETAAPTYFGWGRSFTAKINSKKSCLDNHLPWARKAPGGRTTIAARTLNLNDVDALFSAGNLPAEKVDIVCRERIIVPQIFSKTSISSAPDSNTDADILRNAMTTASRRSEGAASA